MNQAWVEHGKALQKEAHKEYGLGNEARKADQVTSEVVNTAGIEIKGRREGLSVRSLRTHSMRWFSTPEVRLRSLEKVSDLRHVVSNLQHNVPL